PFTKGDERNPFDVFVYLLLLAASVVALALPGVHTHGIDRALASRWSERAVAAGQGDQSDALRQLPRTAAVFMIGYHLFIISTFPLTVCRPGRICLVCPEK